MNTGIEIKIQKILHDLYVTKCQLCWSLQQSQNAIVCLDECRWPFAIYSNGMEWEWLIDECDTRQYRSRTKNPKHVCVSPLLSVDDESSGMHTVRWSEGRTTLVQRERQPKCSACLFFVIVFRLTSTGSNGGNAHASHIPTLVSFV